VIKIAQFHYKARDGEGILSEGKIEADSQEIVVRRLREKGYFPTEIESLSDDKVSLKERIKRLKSVGLKDLSLFCRQFATMINSGLTIVRALNILSNQTPNYKLKEAIINVREEVEGGLSLSEALEVESDIFPRLFISMIEAGEAGGVLDEVLEEMADHFEKENDLKQKVNSALAYPIVILIVALGVVSFLVVAVLPTFVDLFSDIGMELPLPTRVILGLSETFSNYWYFVLLAIIALIFAAYRYYQSREGRRRIDWLLLKIPIVGDLLIKIEITRFSKTLAVLIKSGVSILDGFEIVSRVMTNRIVTEKIIEARKSVSEGESIAVPLSEDELFPEMVLQMVKIGEETGALDQMLLKVSQFYDKEVESKLEAVVSLIEPVMILVMAVVVGSIVVSIVLPMFDMMQGF